MQSVSQVFVGFFGVFFLVVGFFGVFFVFFQIDVELNRKKQQSGIFTLVAIFAPKFL